VRRGSQEQYLSAYEAVELTSKTVKTLRLQEPTARKRGCRPEAREGQGQKPGILLKVLPAKNTTGRNQCRKKQGRKALNKNRASLHGYANLLILRCSNDVEPAKVT
jgi:hypothetical protein